MNLSTIVTAHSDYIRNTISLDQVEEMFKIEDYDFSDSSKQSEGFLHATEITVNAYDCYLEFIQTNEYIQPDFETVIMNELYSFDYYFIEVENLSVDSKAIVMALLKITSVTPENVKNAFEKVSKETRLTVFRMFV